MNKNRENILSEMGMLGADKKKNLWKNQSRTDFTPTFRLAGLPCDFDLALFDYRLALSFVLLLQRVSIGIKSIYCNQSTPI